jgi:hypothetical protein
MDTIYVTRSGCVHCDVVVKFMNSRPTLAQRVSVRYVDTDAGAAADYSRLGVKARPVAVIDGRTVIGDAPIIKAIRSKYGI